MNCKREFNKRRAHTVFENFVVRFLLFASIKGKSLESESEVREKIRRRKYKVLIIDDEKTFRDGFTLMLQKIYGMEVDEVCGGGKGVERVAVGNDYDFIFIDMMMPEKTGIETYFALREIDSKAQIIIMSADPGSRDCRKARKIEDVTVIGKPISRDVLIKIFNHRRDIDDRQRSPDSRR